MALAGATRKLTTAGAGSRQGRDFARNRSPVSQIGGPVDCGVSDGWPPTPCCPLPRCQGASCAIAVRGCRAARRQSAGLGIAERRAVLFLAKRDIGRVLASVLQDVPVTEMFSAKRRFPTADGGSRQHRPGPSRFGGLWGSAWISGGVSVSAIVETSTSAPAGAPPAIVNQATEQVETNAAAPSRETATSYAEWKRAAMADDERSGAARWRAEERSSRYDFQVIRRRFDELRSLNDGGDAHALLFYLNEGIHGNTGGIGQPKLYNRAKFGTKDLVTQYIGEVAEAIERVGRADVADIPFVDKLDFFRRASLCFGRSALMFSGGGALGPFHLGVAKALLEQELLPSVISGASAGSLVAALLGTHRKEELQGLVEGRGVLTAFGEMSESTAADSRGSRRLAVSDVREAIWGLVPDMTFAEAFEHTGRKINIPVSPAEVHQTSRLMNAVTSPNVLIRETVLASCAIPGVFPAVALAAKNRLGERVPYVASRKWVDGSISDDLPARRLTRLYGVNHFITSQTNPVVLWAVRDTGFDTSLLSRLIEIQQSAAREWLRATYPLAMSFIKDSYPLNMYARMAYSVAMQDYTADINVIPRRRLWDPRKLLSVLSEDETRELIREGERATWPKVEMIRNCTLIGRTLDRIGDELEHEFTARATHLTENRTLLEEDWSPH